MIKTRYLSEQSAQSVLRCTSIHLEVSARPHTWPVLFLSVNSQWSSLQRRKKEYMYDDRTRIQASKHGIAIAVALVLYVMVMVMVMVLAGSNIPREHI